MVTDEQFQARAQEKFDNDRAAQIAYGKYEGRDEERIANAKSMKRVGLELSKIADILFEDASASSIEKVKELLAQ